MQPLHILTWHVHGSYLYYLSQVPHIFYLPVKPDHSEGYGGRLPGYPWPDNVRDVPAEEVKNLKLDCILYQSARNYQEDRQAILSSDQRRLPAVYLEHDPPRQHPTDTRHIVDDAAMLLVHVTYFNALMWDNGSTPTRVVEHGVIVPEDTVYCGDLNRGISVVNGLYRRGRRLGADVFDRARTYIPLDLVGMESEKVGGLGAVPHGELLPLAARYRFFFNPIRYTSLGLAVCEAMMIGMPIIGLATTEMATIIENEVSGYVHTDPDQLLAYMQELLADPVLAHQLSIGARRQALERFHIRRFVDDWLETFRMVTG
ncbi:MAG: glycosyltransferase [Chloroflexota bacterium]